MKRFLIFSALLAVLCYGAMAQNRKGTFNTMSELRTLLEVDRLPEYRGGVVEQISSYDPTGGNEDGFAGKYSYIRKEDNGHLVLADLEGPGVVNRIWTPTPTRDTLLFFLRRREGTTSEGLFRRSVQREGRAFRTSSMC